MRKYKINSRKFQKVTVTEINKLTERLSPTAIAVLPASLHYCHLQHQQIQELLRHNSFEEKVPISVGTRKELLISHPP